MLKNNYFKKILSLLSFVILTLTNSLKAQGVDVIFYMDNSGSIDTNEYTGMVETTKNIITKILSCNTYNRAAVVHFGTPNNNDRNGSSIYIESDFTNNLTNLQSFQRRGGIGTALGVSDFAAISLKVVGDALDGVTNSHILSTQKKLTRNTRNKLVIFYFTDADKQYTSGSMIIDPTTPADPYGIYNTFKSSRGATFVPLYTSSGGTAANDDVNKSALAAVASVGGSYTGAIDNNPGDPQGNQVSPRKLYVATNFSITTTQLDDLSDDICRSCAPVIAINALTPLTQTYCTNNTLSSIKKIIVDATGTGVLSYKWFRSTTNSNSGGTEILGATSLEYMPPITQGTIYYYVEVTDSFCDGKSVSPIVSVTVSDCTTPNCKKPSTATNASTPTQTGITIQQKRTTWPQDIPNGWLTLESKTKGFVITRVASTADIAYPKEGMLVYDISANCVKLYNGTTWGCLEKNCSLPQ